MMILERWSDQVTAVLRLEAHTENELEGAIAEEIDKYNYDS